jgi:hypothetical protein
MQRFLDKWGMWFALVIVGSIIAYGLISGLMKEEAPATKPVMKFESPKTN